MKKIGVYINPNGQFMDVYQLGSEIIKIPSGSDYVEIIEQLAAATGRDPLQISALYSVYSRLQEPMTLKATNEDVIKMVELLRTAVAMLYHFLHLE